MCNQHQCISEHFAIPKRCPTPINGPCPSPRQPWPPPPCFLSPRICLFRTLRVDRITQHVIFRAWRTSLSIVRVAACASASSFFYGQTRPHRTDVPHYPFVGRWTSAPLWLLRVVLLHRILCGHRFSMLRETQTQVRTPPWKCWARFFLHKENPETA